MADLPDKPPSAIVRRWLSFLFLSQLALNMLLETFRTVLPLAVNYATAQGLPTTLRPHAARIWPILGVLSWLALLTAILLGAVNVLVSAVIVGLVDEGAFRKARTRAGQAVRAGAFVVLLAGFFATTIEVPDLWRAYVNATIPLTKAMLTAVPATLTETPQSGGAACPGCLDEASLTLAMRSGEKRALTFELPSRQRTNRSLRIDELKLEVAGRSGGAESGCGGWLDYAIRTPGTRPSAGMVVAWPLPLTTETAGTTGPLSVHLLQNARPLTMEFQFNAPSSCSGRVVLRNPRINDSDVALLADIF